MNRLRKPAMMHALLGIAAAWGFTLGAAGPAHAQIWSEYAMVSATMGVSDGRVCVGEGSRGDIGCPSFAPTVSPTGHLHATAGLTVDSVSLTTTGTTWGYLGSGASYLPNLASNAVSATTISTTMVQIASTTAVTTCDSGAMGALRYNSTSSSLELCNGTSWQSVGSGGGVGMPTGTIAAFASSTCPTGWTEYTAARGRFLRGIDNGAGNDPDGTRAPGNVQADALKSHLHSVDPPSTNTSSAGNHTHAFPRSQSSGSSGTGYDWRADIGKSTNANIASAGAHTHTVNIAAFNSAATGDAETRPKNVAVIFCQYSGSGGGSGGGESSSTIIMAEPAGDTGQIQYNTGGSFDASAGLVWNNAQELLTATHISTTSLTVNGVDIASGLGAGSTDTLVSSSIEMVVNDTGFVSLSTVSVTWGYFGEEASYLPNLSTESVSTSALYVNGVEITGTPSASGDSITSGTTGVYTYADTSATIATAGVERVVVGTNGNVGIGQQPQTDVALAISGTAQATIVKLANDPADACTTDSIGAIKSINGRIYVCRQ